MSELVHPGYKVCLHISPSDRDLDFMKEAAAVKEAAKTMNCPEIAASISNKTLFFAQEGEGVDCPPIYLSMGRAYRLLKAASDWEIDGKRVILSFPLWPEAFLTIERCFVPGGVRYCSSSRDRGRRRVSSKV